MAEATATTADAGTKRVRRSAAEIIEEKKAKARAQAERANKALADLEAGITSQSSGNRKGREANPAVAAYHEAVDNYNTAIQKIAANYTSMTDADAVAALQAAASANLGAVVAYVRTVGPAPTTGLLRWHATEETKTRFAKVAPASTTTPAQV